MSAVIKQLTNISKNKIIYPITKAKAVYMEDNITVENAINTLNKDLSAKWRGTISGAMGKNIALTYQGKLMNVKNALLVGSYHMVLVPRESVVPLMAIVVIKSDRSCIISKINSDSPINLFVSSSSSNLEITYTVADTNTVYTDIYINKII